MAGNSLGLGKGLDALIRETGSTRDVDSVRILPLGDIIPNPNQPRRKFTEKALEELAASISSQGLLQPILVRPFAEGGPGKYEIVAGERRWRACKLAGLKEAPVVVRNFTAQETLAAALIENLQREDLNPVEEALGMQMLKDEFDLSQEDLAKKLGKSRSAIANSLRLLSLPEHFRKDLADGRLSAGHARALLSITDGRPQEYLRNLILEEHLSVREAEGLAAAWKETGTFTPESGLFSRSAQRDGNAENNGDRPEGVAHPDQVPADAQGEGHTAPEPGDARALGKADAVTGEDAPFVTPSVTLSGGAQVRGTRPQSARLLEIQNRLHAVLSLPVRVTGKDSKGKISLTYSSKEELESLMNMLALVAGESSSRVALAGAERTALQASSAPALEGADNLALRGSEARALGSTHTVALPGQNAKALTGMSEEAQTELMEDAEGNAGAKDAARSGAETAPGAAAEEQ